MVCGLLYFLHSILQAQSRLECSSNSACPCDVISCQCQDAQAKELAWKVNASPTTLLFSQVYDRTSVVGEPTTQGDYTAILNSVTFLSSQLNITLSQHSQVTVLCGYIPGRPDTETLLLITGKGLYPLSLLLAMCCASYIRASWTSSKLAGACGSDKKCC